jgi:cyclopropane-fatty-acyl-phospholipid synthase
MTAPMHKHPSLAERALFSVFSHLRAGTLELVTSDGSARQFVGPAVGPSARIEIRDPRAATRLLSKQAIGMAEGYIAGEWDTPNLDAVLDLGLLNLTDKPVGVPKILNPLQRAWHAMRDNSPTGSKRNIAAHYDLGNDFYRLWLDESMAYSSAIFEEGDEDLTPAQVRKWDRMLDLLQPGASDHLLEIGCGWGGFAIHAAQQSGCRVTGVTLSEEQHAWATRAVERAGLEGKIDLRLQDYRDIGEGFSAIASIEMFEAVGVRWWPVFFSRLRELLSPGGAIALQTITIDDARFDEYLREPDFIQRYIFPGGMLPSPQRFRASAEENGLRVGSERFFGDSYSRTLKAWSERFESSLPTVHELGFDDDFARMWRYYLAYCRAGFDAGTVDVMQVRLEV